MEELKTLIPIVTAILGALFSYVIFLNNTKKKANDEGQHSGTLLTEIGYIKANTDDIKRRIETQEQRYIETTERLTVVEQSAKQAHLRIDKVEQLQWQNMKD